MTINVPSVPCPSLRDSAMVEAIRLADPMHAVWQETHAMKVTTDPSEFRRAVNALHGTMRGVVFVRLGIVGR